VANLERTARTATYDGGSVRLDVVDVRQLAEHDGPHRHTFTTRVPDGILVCVSWDPDQPADKPGAWQRWATGRESGVGGHEILPMGGHESACWWSVVLPTGGQWFCPR